MTGPVQAVTDRPVVLVVGGTSGIGLAAARLLAQDVLVVLAARDPAALARAARTLDPPPSTVALDVTDEQSVRDGVAGVLARHGRLDAVITTAQVMAYGTVEEIPSEVFARVVDTGVVGTANLARAVLPVFRRQGRGTLVVVSSLLARISVPSMGAYNAAKWGQLGLVRAMQMELRHERDIHVCLVYPGAVDTPIYDQAATYAGSHGFPPPPVVSPERVAAAAVACLSRPRRQVDVPRVNKLSVLGFRVLPAVYDRVAGPVVRRVALRGRGQSDSRGNVLSAVPALEAERGGWSWAGRR